MQQGNIGVTSENIFPVIKQFLYSDHEIFLREIVANAVDATQKVKALATAGKLKEDLGDLTIRIAIDEKEGTLTVSDRGIGMTDDEVNRYINQIAFSGAGEFLEKYKNQSNAIIGHFGLGFYSSFMVSDRVDIITKSYREGSEALKWSCDGSPTFTMEAAERDSRGADIVLHFDEESKKEFLNEAKINELLNKYCRYMPVPIAFGKEKEWKDGKQVETDKDHIVNTTEPLWTRKPADLKEEDYLKFYRELYPMQTDPMFYIHLNVDYPFHLTGILYFPKIKTNIDFQKNKIQLYCNQVFVTDSVENIVPDFLTLLHGVIDSPDIPLNVSRSYLQSDANVKKISSHITKKVADRLEDIFKTQREEFEKKWDNLKLFIAYGMITDEKFYERAEKFALLKNTDGKFFTLEEYRKLIEGNQTDKNKKLVYLYTTDKVEQYAYIEAAKAKGYDVLDMDGQLDLHWINHLESKMQDTVFTRVDADIIERLIEKEELAKSTLGFAEQEELRPVFEGVLPEKSHFYVTFENLSADGQPLVITQSEYMRRMKDLSAMNPGMSFYGEMPDSYNLIVNTSHPLVQTVIQQKNEAVGKETADMDAALQPVEKALEELNKRLEGKKDEEIPQAQKDEREKLEKEADDMRSKKEQLLKEYGKKSELAKQMVDLALLANNLLKGEALSRFIRRSVDLLK
ncbi:MAG: molecular chaperone HtpG [Bacteroidales bacterium]|nr:molecular chaperone HtpG [Bacteroidales bacterium]